MDWEKCLICIAIRNAYDKGKVEGQIFIDAEVCGDWAVHKTIDRYLVFGPYMHRDCYTLTHLPTRCAAVQTDGIEAAKEFARAIKNLSWHLVKNGMGKPPAGFEICQFVELRAQYQIDF